MDLDAVVEGLASKYPTQYLNDVKFICNPIRMSKPLFDEVSDRIAINMNWKCSALLQDAVKATILLGGKPSIR